MPNSVEFKNRINDFVVIEEKKKTKLCKEIGIDSRSLTLAVELGVFPSPKTIAKIADYYKISFDYLVGLSEIEDFTPAKTPSSFTERLNEILKTKGYTKYKVAKIAKTNMSYVSKWAQGKFTPSLDNLESLSLSLNVSIDYLWGRSDF